MIRMVKGGDDGDGGRQLRRRRSKKAMRKVGSRYGKERRR